MDALNLNSPYSYSGTYWPKKTLKTLIKPLLLTLSNFLQRIFKQKISCLFKVYLSFPLLIFVIFFIHASFLGRLFLGVRWKLCCETLRCRYLLLLFPSHSMKLTHRQWDGYMIPLFLLFSVTWYIFWGEKICEYLQTVCKKRKGEPQPAGRGHFYLLTCITKFNIFTCNYSSLKSRNENIFTLFIFFLINKIRC